MNGFEEYNHLSFACTLCGKCTWECPVKIPLHKLLLFNRRDAVAAGFTDKSFSMVMKAYKKVMNNDRNFSSFHEKHRNENGV